LQDLFFDLKGRRMQLSPGDLVDEEGEADYNNLKAGERTSALATS
jgi:hypothetical protein